MQFLLALAEKPKHHMHHKSSLSTLYRDLTWAITRACLLQSGDAQSVDNRLSIIGSNKLDTDGNMATSASPAVWYDCK